MGTGSLIVQSPIEVSEEKEESELEEEYVFEGRPDSTVTRETL